MDRFFESKVRDLSSLGAGVVDHPDGRVFFVSDVWPGDEGQFEITSTEKRYGYARLVKLQKASPDRQEVFCPHRGFEEGKCGGCSWMIGNYPSQLAFKNQIVRHSLTRALGEEQLFHLKTIQASPKTTAFRNRAQLKTDGKRLGFVSFGSQVIAPVTNCAVLNDRCNEKLTQLLGKLPNPDWNPAPGRPWKFLDIDDLTENITINRRLPFRQANDDQNEWMKNWLRSQLKEQNNFRVLELFCGSGNFTKTLSEMGFENIYAFEASEEAIEKLRGAKLPKVEAFSKDLFRKASFNEIRKISGPVECLVLDPPRIGFKALCEFLEHFPELQQIVYISCDLPSLARDLAKLVRKKNWKITEIQPIDQFPHTPHIEMLVNLRL